MITVTVSADIAGNPRMVFFNVDQDGVISEYGPIFTNADFDADAYCAILAAKIGAEE